jgi:hypothetical protein
MAVGIFLIQVPSTQAVTPINLVSSAISSSEVSLSWNKVDGVDSYNIYRNDNSLFPNYKKIANVPSGFIVFSYTDKGLNASTQYSYYVTPYSLTSGEGDSSNTTYVTTASSTYTPAPPVVYGPTNLTATTVVTPTNSIKVILKWDPTLDSYARIHQSWDGIDYLPMGTILTGPGYFEQIAYGSGPFWYKVTGYNKMPERETPFSNIVKVDVPVAYTTPPPAVYGPSNLSAAVVTSSSTSKVVLTWDSDRSSYGNVYRSEDGYTYTWIKYVLTGPGYYEDIYVAPGKNYWYKVTGSSDNQRNNESPFSNSVMVVIPGSGLAPEPMPPVLCPYPVSNFIATTFSPNRVLLSWSTPVDKNHPAPERYNIYFGAPPNVSGQVTVSGNQNSYLDTEIHPYNGYGIEASTRGCPSERTQILGNSGGVGSSSSALNNSDEPVRPAKDYSLVSFSELPPTALVDISQKAQTLKFKYSYQNNTATTERIMLRRQILDGNGKIVRKVVGYRVVKSGDTINIPVVQVFNKYSKEGNFTTKVEVIDRKTGEVLDTNSFDVTVVKKSGR